MTEWQGGHIITVLKSKLRRDLQLCKISITYSITGKATTVSPKKVASA